MPDPLLSDAPAGDPCQCPADPARSEMRGQITFDGENIVDVTEGDTVPAGAVDCAGDIVSPGW